MSNAPTIDRAEEALNLTPSFLEEPSRSVLSRLVGWVIGLPGQFVDRAKQKTTEQFEKMKAVGAAYAEEKIADWIATKRSEFVVSVYENLTQAPEEIDLIVADESRDLHELRRWVSTLQAKLTTDPWLKLLPQEDQEALATSLSSFMASTAETASNTYQEMCQILSCCIRHHPSGITRGVYTLATKFLQEDKPLPATVGGLIQSLLSGDPLRTGPSSLEQFQEITRLLTASEDRLLSIGINETPLYTPTSDQLRQAGKRIVYNTAHLLAFQFVYEQFFPARTKKDFYLLALRTAQSKSTPLTQALSTRLLNDIAAKQGSSWIQKVLNKGQCLMAKGLFWLTLKVILYLFENSYHYHYIQIGDDVDKHKRNNFKEIKEMALSELTHYFENLSSAYNHVARSNQDPLPSGGTVAQPRSLHEKVVAKLYGKGTWMHRIYSHFSRLELAIATKHSLVARPFVWLFCKLCKVEARVEKLTQLSVSSLSDAQGYQHAINVLLVKLLRKVDRILDEKQKAGGAVSTPVIAINPAEKEKITSLIRIMFDILPKVAATSPDELYQLRHPDLSLQLLALIDGPIKPIIQDQMLQVIAAALYHIINENTLKGIAYQFLLLANEIYEPNQSNSTTPEEVETSLMELTQTILQKTVRLAVKEALDLKGKEKKKIESLNLDIEAVKNLTKTTSQEILSLITTHKNAPPESLELLSNALESLVLRHSTTCQKIFTKRAYNTAFSEKDKTLVEKQVAPILLPSRRLATLIQQFRQRHKDLLVFREDQRYLNRVSEEVKALHNDSTGLATIRYETLLRKIHDDKKSGLLDVTLRKNLEYYLIQTLQYLPRYNHALEVFREVSSKVQALSNLESPKKQLQEIKDYINKSSLESSDKTQLLQIITGNSSTYIEKLTAAQSSFENRILQARDALINNVKITTRDLLQPIQNKIDSTKKNYEMKLTSADDNALLENISQQTQELQSVGEQLTLIPPRNARSNFGIVHEIAHALLYARLRPLATECMRLIKNITVQQGLVNKILEVYVRCKDPTFTTTT